MRNPVKIPIRAHGTGQGVVRDDTVLSTISFATYREPIIMNARYFIHSALLGIAMVSSPMAGHAAIVGISIPVNSSDATSHPLVDNVWSVSAPAFPLNISSGIGFLINPNVRAPSSNSDLNDFSLHDHFYVSSNVPDPTRAVVTFHFDISTIVKGVEVIQHQNGISKIEGFSGNALNTLASLGSVFGPSGDITGASLLTEWSSQTFDFGNTVTAGDFFQLVVRKTPLANGWASYRIFPLDVNGNRIAPALTAVPLPAAAWLLSSAICALGFRRRRAG